MNIVCSSCFTTNRIPDDKDHKIAKCGKCKNNIYSCAPISLSVNNFDAYIKRNTLPVVVDYWASWCGPCQSMAPIFNDVAKTSPNILFAKVNTENSQQLAHDANIRSIPTLVLFHQGKEVNRISGGLTMIQMKQWLAQCINAVK